MAGTASPSATASGPALRNPAGAGSSIACERRQVRPQGRVGMQPRVGADPAVRPERSRAPSRLKIAIASSRNAPPRGRGGRHRRRRDADGQAFDRRLRRGHVIRHGVGDRGRIVGIAAGHQAQQQRRVLGTARQRSDRIQRLRQRHRAGAADAPDGRLQAGDAEKCAASGPNRRCPSPMPRTSAAPRPLRPTPTTNRR